MRAEGKTADDISVAILAGGIASVMGTGNFEGDIGGPG